jgi:organic hydroperoxide reductase OsmC/OhrA
MASSMHLQIISGAAIMKELPHHYSVRASAGAEADVTLTAVGIPALATASPAEFGGPGDRWSPETLLVGAVANCFTLTFRGVARASKLQWTTLRCDVTGILDRVDRVTQFTSFDLHAQLCVPPGTDGSLAQRSLEKAEQACLIANSLKAPIHLHLEVVSECEESAA